MLNSGTGNMYYFLLAIIGVFFFGSFYMLEILQFHSIYQTGILLRDNQKYFLKKEPSKMQDTALVIYNIATLRP